MPAVKYSVIREGACFRGMLFGEGMYYFQRDYIR